MALTRSLPPVSTRPSRHPYRRLVRADEHIDAAPFLTWYDRMMERRRALGLSQSWPAMQGETTTPLAAPIDELLVFHGTNARRISQARKDGTITMNVILAALEALDPWTDAWQLAWEADQAVRELVPFRDAHGRDLLEPAIAAVEEWHRWT